MHTVKCTICQGSFDSNKILLFYTHIHFIYLSFRGIWIKNRHLNHKRKMGEEKGKLIKLQKLQIIVHHRGRRTRQRKRQSKKKTGRKQERQGIRREIGLAKLYSAVGPVAEPDIFSQGG